ncbi:hypothetical protein COT65_00105 [Candidatus Shapirobacteria bacterium CG09_land_8_20_14_0_10_47_13]|uniref:HEPN domain-containing protein n=1 Tax=Candidatus Shapirobacteria bacterium CG09_land_8_20_14_0_10_47_13 TaxID=1974481 RepID=A0A2H0WQH9_9BACT|nr:MAG: hypothetical protein COT65_00105 [Candidatus Shapirobacteria bacterium CG09_land_8_20_14_0_10_47_13]
MKPPKYQKDIEDFLATAENELKYIQWDLKGKLYVAVSFWSQQVAEKSLKALWLFFGKKPIKIHSLERLAKEVEELAPEINQIREKLRFLDKFYIATRYPNGHLLEGELKEDDALKAKKCAEEIFDFVRKKMGSSG